MSRHSAVTFSAAAESSTLSSFSLFLCEPLLAGWAVHLSLARRKRASAESSALAYSNQPSARGAYATSGLAQWLVLIREGGNNSKNGSRRVHLVPPGWYDNPLKSRRGS